jgi:4-hydroxybenzoate polyprenyltransferase
VVRALVGVVDALVFSSIWVSLAAGVLCVAAARGMGVALPGAAACLAFAGTLFVYGVDRLRDVEHDRHTAPARSAFIESHAPQLTALTVGAGGLAAVLAVRAGLAVAALAAPLGAVGLLHRRLKHIRVAKSLYVSGVWIAVVVGVPAASSGAPRHSLWTILILFSALYANALASSLREVTGPALREHTRILWLARASALLGVLGGALAPQSLRPLTCVPLATLAVLLAFRPAERYVAFAVDGALIGGALLALAWL